MLGGQQNKKRSAFIGFAFGPDIAPVVLYHFSGDREADSGARILGTAVQPCKYLEDTFGIRLPEADTLIAYGNEVK